MYKYIYSQIKYAVSEGVLKPEEKLPSIRQAAAELNVSRTTVENAYVRLCIEGIAESRPQRGYFICKKKESYPQFKAPDKKEPVIEYDFSSHKIDTATADTSLWKKNVRAALNNSQSLISYGQPAGQYELRCAISDYAFKARGVKSNPQNIIIGAGVGPLLNILCGLTGKGISVGIENGGFKQAELIFSDYEIPLKLVKSDMNGVMTDELNQDINVLFLLPSALSKISVSGINLRRNKIIEWLSENDERFIIEDDYNGELRYTARAVGAFQGKAPEKTVYIGSFSKLLLPSVRIAYMVLPDFLAEKFRLRQQYHNQTCGKTEQMALCSYINSGSLEKHLRRLRKLYSSKSKIMMGCLSERKDIFEEFTLYESSLTAEVKTVFTADSKALCDLLLKNGVSVIPANKEGTIRLSFAGIAKESIVSGVNKLCDILTQNCLKV